MKTADGKEKAMKIGGTAFSDEALRNLHMSYRNPSDYQQEWHWGHLGKMRLKGSWTNYGTIKNEKNKELTVSEHNHYLNRIGNRILYVADILKGRMCKIDYENSYDNGINITQAEALDIAKKPFTQTYITIPASGLYKIRFEAGIVLDSGKVLVDSEKKVKFVPSYSHIYGTNNTMNHRGFELKLMRDFGEDFNIENISLDSSLYKKNMPQEAEWTEKKENAENAEEPDVAKNDIPYSFPVVGTQCVQFIDPAVNQNLISGFRWGKHKKLDYSNPTTMLKENLNEVKKDYNYILAIKHGWSWDVTFSQKDKIFSAINSPAYAVRDKPITLTGDEALVEEDEANPGTENVFDWYFNRNKHKIEVQNAPKNEISSNYLSEASKNNGDLVGNGELSQIIWLNKGERITIVDVSEIGTSFPDRKSGWIKHGVSFDLSIEPFRKEWEWIKVSNEGDGTESMNWNDKGNFEMDKINLLKFLPSEEKIDDWIDNFCKAFNLQLVQTAEGEFELNLKQQKQEADNVIDLSDRAGLEQRNNTPLGLPDIYELGFKIEKEEEGFVKSKGANAKEDDGGGRFVMGTIEGTTLSQISNFSYNWFKEIKRMETIKTPIVDENGAPVLDENGEVKIKIEVKEKFKMQLPVISNKEVWSNTHTRDYAEMMSKTYTNYAQRFWYRDKKETYDLGSLWYRTIVDEDKDKLNSVKIPALKNNYEGKRLLKLNYRDEPNSVLRNYFNVIAGNDSNYTEIECYLTPNDYEQLDGSSIVKYNGDLYYVASVDGYDPTGRNKTKLRLIRKMK